MTVRRLVACLALLLGSSAAFGQQTPPIPDLPIESYRLPNGLKVVLHRDPAVPRVTVCVAYHVGSKNERAGRTGFAHFFEHMMFRGTKNVPNYDIPLQETGAQSNAFTTEDVTVYFESVPSTFLERALYLEAERLAFLPTALDQEKFDTEREVVKNERRQSYENVPYGLAEESLLAHVFPKGHPYSWSVIGSMKDLDAATLDDLKRFFAEFYHPGNASLCVAGDFDPAKAKEMIAAYFGPLAAGPAIKPVVAPAGTLKKTESLTLADRVSLPRIYWAWPTVPDDHADAPALGLLASILADGEASRLHRALVRDARVATEVDASSLTNEASGMFTVDATAADGKTLDDVTKTLDAVFAEWKTKPPTADELARALAKFEKSTFQGLTSQLRRAHLLAIGFVQKDDPAYYRKDFARYYGVTTDDLVRVAKTYLTPEKVTLAIRPVKEGEAKSEAEIVGPLPGPAADAAFSPRPPQPGPDWTKMPGPDLARSFLPPRFVRKRMSNGLDVWVAPWHTLPVVQATLVVPVGTADDPEGKSGVAALTAALLDKGTRAQTSTELAESLETLGVTLGVRPGSDSTSVGFSVLARNLKPAFEKLGQVLTSPRFDPADFDRERKLQLDDLLQGPDSPSWIARRAFPTLLYGPGHPYANPTQGRVETVGKLTIDDVRAFHDRFGANQSTLIVVGDVEPDALIETLEATLGAWKTTAEPPKDRPSVRTQPEPGVVYLADKPGAVQSILAVGRRWEDRNSPKYFANVIGNHVVGADFLSRLNANLREKNGYTYGAGSGFSYRRVGSVWQVSTQVRADVTAEALKEVLGELDALGKDRPLSAEEIATARDAEIRSFPETFEDPSGIAGALAELAQFRLPMDYFDAYLKHLADVPDAAIRAATVEVASPDFRTILVVGDRASVEPKLKAMGFREIRVINPDGLPVAR
ncbi:M16 family metallopeptidase [Tundrisphaera sp. TA3]|uniref:M16 family metallopeptidase n=1 Tax=Tundrisphaera sp. TA3 TaxID=3435775 RepID=UPI003EB79362